jgi:5'-nucleotidase
VIERGGIRFGIFGLLGKEAQFYTTGAGAVSFPDAIETAKEMVAVLREREKVDVVIGLSHDGVEKDKDGRFTDGDDVRVVKAVPGIDILIGGHSHTELKEAIIVNGRTPVVQTGVSAQNLGELVIALDGEALRVESYQLHPIDDTIAGDRAIGGEIDALKNTVTEVVFASRGYSIDQALAVAPQDLPNTFTDIEGGTILANLVTDAFREATKADVSSSSFSFMRE